MPRKLRDWMSAYLEYAQFSEAPDQFHQWTAVATIAGALRRRVWLPMGHFQWYPNFYICLVAPPGVVSKGSTANIGMSLLREVPGIKFGPDAATWQALVTAMTAAREDYALPDGTYTPMSALTISAAELGTFLRPEDDQMLMALILLWDGSDAPFRKATKKDGTETIVNPWLNLLGCTTPAWIAHNFNQTTVEGGLTSRVLFVYGETKRKLIAYPGLHVSTAQEELRAKLILDLADIAEMHGAFAIEPAALEWGIKWYETHNDPNNPLMLDNRTAGYAARKQAHIHKTAMVLSAAQSSKGNIALEHLVKAEQMVTALELHMPRVFNAMNQELVAQHTVQLLRTLYIEKQMEKHALFRRVMNRIGVATFNDCITSLMTANLVQVLQTGNTIQLRYIGPDKLPDGG